VYLDAATITVFVFFAFDFFVSAKLEKGYLFSVRSTLDLIATAIIVLQIGFFTDWLVTVSASARALLQVRTSSLSLSLFPSSSLYVCIYVCMYACMYLSIHTYICFGFFTDWLVTVSVSARALLQVRVPCYIYI